MGGVAQRFCAYVLAGLLFGGGGWITLQQGLVFRIGGGFTFCLGLFSTMFLLIKVSVVQFDGIRINPAFVIAAMDLVLIAAAMLSGFFIVDGWADRFSLDRTFVGEPLAADVIAFMFLPSAALFSWFVTTNGKQTVTVMHDAVSVSGIFGVQRVVWSDVLSIKPKEQYVVVSRIGFLLPRHLRTNMDILTIDQRTLRVFEPGLKSTRREILKRMHDTAPQKLEPQLDAMVQAWL